MNEVTLPEYSLDDATYREQNPMADFLRMERMPHIWCPGCGIGTVVTSFAEAIKASGIDLDKIAVVSGIGCTGRVAGYVKFDSFHTTHGRAIPFATGLKLANPELKVVVISGDGDLTSIGGNHLIHAARRNMDLTVICVNNFTYGMTGGQVTPTTPTSANASTTPYGNYETGLQPAVPGGCGRRDLRRPLDLAARPQHHQVHRRGAEPPRLLVHRGDHALHHALSAPQPPRRRRGRHGILPEDGDIQHGADTRTVDIGYQGKIAMGKFVDRPRDTYLDAVVKHLTQRDRRRLRTLRQDAAGEEGRGRRAQERRRHGRSCGYL